MLFAGSVSASDNQMNQNRATTQEELASGYNAPARYDVFGAWDLHLAGSFIFWQPKQQALAFGVRSAAAPGAQTTSRGDVIDLDYKFKPGFKVALGLGFDYDNWDLLARYTWLYQDESKSYPPLSGGQGIEALWKGGGNDNPILAITIVEAKAKWDLKLNLIDLELGRAYYVGSKLTLRPFFGLRGTIIDQDYTVHYTANSITFKTTVDQDSWFVGLRSGVGTNYILGAGFRIFSNAALALGYERFDVTVKEETFSAPSTLYLYYKDKLGQIIPNPELGIGLGWGTYCLNDSCHFDLGISYDFQVIFNQNMMENIYCKAANTSTNNEFSGQSGDLFLQGLTLCLRFDF